MASTYSSYKLNSTGQYIPEVALTDDPEELKLLEKPIGRWGREWQNWMTENHWFEKNLHVFYCSWQIVARKIDIMAQTYYDQLSEEYNQIHNDRPSADQAFEVCRWEKKKALYIENEIRKEYIYCTYKDEIKR